MKRLLLSISLSLTMMYSFAQQLNGILFESRYPVTIRLDGQKVNLPSQTSFVANLRPGVYNVSADVKGRVVYNNQIRYNGRGTMIVSIDNPEVCPPSTGPDYTGRVEPMSQGQFESLLKGVNNESFDDRKVAMIKMSTINSYFTSQQVAQLVKTLSFSKSQLDIAKYLFKFSVDPENYYRIVGNAFSFTTTKRELENYINQVLNEMNRR